MKDDHSCGKQGIGPSPRDERVPCEPVRSGGQTLSTARIGSGPRVVLLHGGPGLDHRSVLPLARRLAESLEVWLPDLPGHGRSHDGAARLPDLHAVVDRTGRWLDGLGPDLWVIGHSLGAWVAREATRRGRFRPKRSVWVAPPAGSGPGRRSAVRARADAIETHTGTDTASVRDEFLVFAASDTVGPLSDEYRAAVEGARFRAPREYGALLRQLHRALLRATPTFAAVGEVLVVCGERDRTTPPSHARAVADATPGADLAIVAGEGHVPCADGSRSIADRVVRFLERSDVDR